MRRILLIIALFTLSLNAHAATITVDNDGTDEVGNGNGCSLREAVINANTDSNAVYSDCEAGSSSEPDVIELPNNYIYFIAKSGAHEDNSLTGDLDIIGELTIKAPDDGVATISALDLSEAASPDRVFELIFGNFTLENVDVQDVELKTSDGTVSGGVLKIGFLGLDVVIRNCNFHDNIATIDGENDVDGFLIQADNFRTLTITDSSATDNTVSVIGGTGGVTGGLFSFHSADSLSFDSVVVKNNTIESAYSTQGGILFAEGDTESDGQFTQTIFRNNSFTQQGDYLAEGAVVYLGEFPTFTIEDSEFSVNNAFGAGTMSGVYGGVVRYVTQRNASALNINNTTVAHNYTHFNFLNQGTLNFDLSGAEASTVNVQFSTIAYNTLGNSEVGFSDGGGIYLKGSTLNMVASVLSGNAAVVSLGDGQGPNCYSTEDSVFNSDGFNVISNTLDCNLDTSEDDELTEASGLVTLDEHGGFSQTVSINPDSVAYNLVPTYLCVDQFDARGVARSTPFCDSGAYELSYFYTDADGDGYGDDASETSVYESSLVQVGGDCDDTDADISPAETDLCDAIDNNCDGVVDEDFKEVLGEECSAGVGACYGDRFGGDGEDQATFVCTADGLGTVCNADNRGEPETEICDDDSDNDCDGATDLDDADCQEDTGDDDDAVTGDDDTVTGDDDDDDTVTGDDDDDDDTVSGDDDDDDTAVVSICGDSTVDVDEECDDGNTDADDGCSAICTTEVDESTSGSGGGCSLQSTPIQNNAIAMNVAIVFAVIVLMRVLTEQKSNNQNIQL